MANRRYAFRKRLARRAGKPRIADLIQDDIDRLWRELKSGPATDESEAAIYELFKWTAARLRDWITSRSGVRHWSMVTAEMMEQIPRDGLSECQIAVLEDLSQTKRDRSARRAVPGCEAIVPMGQSRWSRTDTATCQKPSGLSCVFLIYYGSKATETRKLYRRLSEKGLDGEIAAELLRVQKASSRAKQYRGDYKDYAYDRKGDRIAHLCELLCRSGFLWGWGEDCGQQDAPWVIYVDLPEGQVSFHSIARGKGPEYPGSWDGRNASERRIIEFAERILDDDR